MRIEEISKIRKAVREKAFSFTRKTGQRFEPVIRVKSRSTDPQQPYPIFPDSVCFETFLENISSLLRELIEFNEDFNSTCRLIRAEIEKCLDEIDSQLDRISSNFNFRVSPKTKEKVFKLLRDDLEKQLSKQIRKPSEEVMETFRVKEGSHKSKGKENKIIKQLIELYKPLNLSERQIIYNLALVFGACDLWPSCKDYPEAMKNRFRKIKKSEC